MDTKVELTFPCEYPIKVMVRMAEGIRPRIDAIVEKHAGPLESLRITERSSAQQNFIGITYIIQAQGPGQIAALFADLKEAPGVMLVL